MTARPDPDPIPADLMDALVQASFAVIARVSQVAATHDLSLTQLRVLAILRDRQPKITELAAHLGLDRSSVSGLVDRAAQRGLVRRDVSETDARAVRVSLTPDGQRLAEAGAAEVAAQLAPMAAALTPADRARLTSLLAKVLV